jgi:formamidopyrimidine-DNA glycosylase
VPELPETETIAKDLDGALRGAVVRSVHVDRHDVLRAASSSRARPLKGAALAHALRARLEGAVVTAVARRAKSVVLSFADDRLVVTPRFTGALLVDGAPDDRYTCVRFELGDDRVLRYHDVRRLGTIALLDGAEYAAWDAGLGPEPLDQTLTVERFSGIIRGSSRAVKSILMDQKRLAGVGNIYANESLWRAGIRPARRGSAVTRAQAATLLADLRAVLAESIALRGTTFRDYRDAYGARGGFATKLQAYGRAGEPCMRCRATLRSSHAIEGRQTVWCAACQR